MIICEECGAHNRDDAYVCAVCEASLLHLKPAPDDEPMPARCRLPLFGRRNRQRNVYYSPEYALDAGESAEPADAAASQVSRKEPQEDASSARRERISRRRHRQEAEGEPGYAFDAGEDSAEPADAAEDSPAYRDDAHDPGDDVPEPADIAFEEVLSQPEPQEDGGLKFVFEDGMPGVESGYTPQEPSDAVENEPVTATAAEEPQEVSPLPDAEAPRDSIEVDLPEYPENRSGRSREVHIRVARVRTVRYRKAVPQADGCEDEHGGAEYDEPDEPERMTRGMIAAIATLASLLVVTLAVLGVLYIDRICSVPAAAPVVTPTASQIVTHVPIPAADAE